ncbi:MAG: MEDS domain-containing protein [Mariniphaga sp.]|nr:MEDS domain-containing protein [Mariniphaga sp.]
MYFNTSKQEKVELGFAGHQCNNGMHMAGLYETEEERDNIILGFFNQGFVNGDINLYCPTERTKEDFIEKFSLRHPHTKDCLHDPNICSFSTTEELYYPEGKFLPWAVDRSLNAFWEESQKNRKVAVRASAEMIWALDKNVDKTKLMAYESRLNYFIPGKAWISICLYNLTRFSGATILQVLQTHPYTIIQSGVITKNPYFINPDIWLKENAPEYLNK